MGRKRNSWEISDEFWERIKEYIPTKERAPGKEYKRKAGGGRKPTDTKKVLSTIFYVLRTGIQWKALQKEEFGNSSAIHRYFMYWSEAGSFEKIWAFGLMEYDSYAYMLRIVVNQARTSNSFMVCNSFTS